MVRFMQEIGFNMDITQSELIAELQNDIRKDAEYHKSMCVKHANEGERDSAMYHSGAIAALLLCIERIQKHVAHAQECDEFIHRIKQQTKGDE